MYIIYYINNELVPVSETWSTLKGYDRELIKHKRLKWFGLVL